MNKNFWAFTACILGLLSVILGAFASHGLRDVLTPQHLESFKTGTYYQMTHAIIILILSCISTLQHQKLIKYVKICFLIGILFFSGSIYLLSTMEVSQMDFTFLGPITPIGGLFITFGWALLGISFLKLKKDN